ncbi:cob(I)yrinic acid a,c-diamide adenosyltransferase [Methanoplanus sp. FWC-SCC4]|uniref:Cob(I)yrinic acid a,c-diamide adenosyltransferase n=1 Tax=Methanochimaera problematica TaxID=2609417 RepID=A0AA97F9T8_9EURY|nr:cob(I)yrinic acid a,c-diamide adenosyltransferase [Methanoplanus sp. FWC-SCC4]WOF15485.1 cob(I)yrinic acid a,c-diamide adenosyltransferase [Methanoplanus sp. FWC-SCC4]
MHKGYIQINTGDGKGKTTAALGTAVRTLVSGKTVFFGQFIKGVETGELRLSEYFPNFEIEQFGKGCFIFDEPTESDIKIAREGLNRCSEILSSGDYSLVVLDEINVAIYYGLLKTDEVIKVLSEKAENTEVILTGRYAPKELIELADLVTEMKKVKHYFDNGVKARRGIEY